MGDSSSIRSLSKHVFFFVTSLNNSVYFVPVAIKCYDASFMYSFCAAVRAYVEWSIFTDFFRETVGTNITLDDLRL